MVLAIQECLTPDIKLSAIHLPCSGGFRPRVDDPPKPWRLRTEWLQRAGVWVGRIFGTPGFPVELNFEKPLVEAVWGS